MQYIRDKDLRTERRQELLNTVRQRLPNLVEKRLSVGVRTDALLDEGLRGFAHKYVDLYQQVDAILHAIDDIAGRKESTDIYVKRI
jgi:hypothetical protein